MVTKQVQTNQSCMCAQMIAFVFYSALKAKVSVTCLCFKYHSL